MAVRISKPAMNLRERLKELDFKKGLVGLKIVKSDTEAEARDALNLEDHLFEDFESTGIDDNATATTLVISDTSTEVSGTLNVDSGTLFVDSVNNRVGVGTSSPVSDLHVKGGVLTLGDEGSSSGYINSEESIYFNADTNNNLDSLFVWGKGRTRKSGGTEYMRIDSSGNLLVGLSVSPKSPANLRVSSGVHVSKRVISHQTDIYNGGSGRTFTVSGGSNGNQSYISFEAMNYVGIIKATCYLRNASGTWFVIALTDTVGTPPSITINEGSTATITVNVNNSSYGGGIINYEFYDDHVTFS